jgi:hypothetical protein
MAGVTAANDDILEPFIVNPSVAAHFDPVLRALGARTSILPVEENPQRTEILNFRKRNRLVGPRFLNQADITCYARIDRHSVRLERNELRAHRYIFDRAGEVGPVPSEPLNRYDIAFRIDDGGELFAAHERRCAGHREDELLS